MIRQTVKVGAIFSLMGIFSLHSLAIGVRKQSLWSLRRHRSRLALFYSRLALKVLGLQVQAEGSQWRSHEAALYVGNHLSYLDILILASQIPTSFVTSEEIRAVPVLGTLCELGGCLFVERRSRARLDAEVNELTEALRHGLNVTVFPEATSTNGEEVLRFRRPLFQAARNAACAVAPFCLNYKKIDDHKITGQNRDTVCWYGDMDFVSHLWTLAGYRHIQVKLSWLERQFDHITKETATEVMAAAAHAAVQTAYNPIPRPRPQILAASFCRSAAI